MQLTGGFHAELLAFSLADPPLGWPRDLVARVMPDSGTARKEMIVQAAVAAAGYPTPVVRASGGPGDGLGRAFMVMDRAWGTSLMPGLTGVSALAAALRQLVRIPEALATAMAALHALDPRLIRDQFAPPGEVSVGEVPVTLGGLLDAIRDTAAQCQRDDLASAARWLIDHPCPPEPEVICHGDLHPFNALVTDGHVTVLDWTAALLAPRAFDVAFTVSMLSEPPITLPGPLRALARRAGRLAARRFVRRYAAHAAVPVDNDDLRWHRAVISLRALSELAGWVYDGTIAERSDHPWLTSGPALATHLTSVTGIPVRPR